MSMSLRWLLAKTFTIPELILRPVSAHENYTTVHNSLRYVLSDFNQMYEMEIFPNLITFYGQTGMNYIQEGLPSTIW